MSSSLVIWGISKYSSPPSYGGSRLFYILREFHKIGAKVLLITSDSNHMASYPDSNKTYNYENQEGVSLIWIRALKYKKSASLKRLLSWFDFEFKLFRLKVKNCDKPDVVIISSLSLFSIVFGMYLKKKYKSKLVLEIRDIYPLYLTEEFGVSKWNPMVLLLGLLEKIGYNKADLIVGTMPNLKEHVNKIVKTKKEVFHSPIGIPDIWEKEIHRSEKVDALFQENDKFIVGYAGSMGISNALDTFVEAIKKMSEDENVYFMLVGSGDLKDEFEKRVSGLNNVTFGPKIPKEDVPYFLSKCDLLYFSARESKIWEYGQSLNKLVDYMMSGKPVVASYSGYQSMLNEANSGLFVPVDDVDAIIEGINYFKKMSKEERTQYGIRGREWVEENHRYEKIAARYYERINSLS